MNSRLHTLCLRLSFLLLPVAAMAGMPEGIAAYKQKDYATALQEFKALAEKGHAAAQSHLGVMIGNGQGTAQDDKEALKWFRLAAEQGDVSAQTNLALMYKNGQGTAQDFTQALHWFRLAAGQGDAMGQAGLGVMYERGQGVQQDMQQALFWYRLAANHGLALAQYNLGLMYAKGQGVPPNPILAYALWSVAAQGHPGADNPAAFDRAELGKSLPPKILEAAQTLALEMAKPGNLIKAIDAHLKEVAALTSVKK